MGWLTDALRLVVPERKTAIGAHIPTWQQGTPQWPQATTPYVRAAREGYGANEVVYACIEELCTSAAEPRLAAYVGQGKNAKQLDRHPVLDLFEHPNPFMSRFSFIASLILYRSIAGNAFMEKTRSAAGLPVQLWPLRPDRMRVIPDQAQYIRGYEYELGDFRTILPAADVIHTKTRHPLDDYYGLPPLAACALRVDTDNYMRSFTAAFFRNAGVPAGLLNIKRSIGAAERELMRNRFRMETGGAQAHSLLVIDDSDVTYTAMGMPLGERGLVLPELDEIDETRLAMVFGVPLELIGARLSMRGQRSAAKEARAGFWDETLSPLYAELAADLTRGLVDEFDGFDYLEFDTATVKALQEDDNAKHDRVRKDVAAGLLTQQEGREALGYDPEPDSDGLWMLGPGITPTPVGEEVPEPEPVPAALDPNAPPDPNATPVERGAKTTGKRPVPITPADVVRAKAHWASVDDPELHAALGIGKNGQH